MSRSMEITKEIDAPVDVVWRAITEGRELAQWFAVDARVTPGPNGSIWLSWGEGAEGEAPLLHWEPNKRMGWAEDHGGPEKLATDFFLEAKGGKTVIRIVTSGFSDDPQWNDEFHMLEGGWTNFAAHLKAYLEHHFGKRRVYMKNRRGTAYSKREAFERIVRALGFPAPPAAPGRFRVTTAQGDTFEGSIVALNPGVQLGLEIDNLDHAMLFLEMEGKKDAAKPGLWLSTYGLPEADTDALAARMGKLYEAALA